ncbi:MAG: DUF885 domain-containing protein [Lachnospiraceae bacterium]|nr:DUF885 domain-containing protein [Lachnospiraceae bacterium]
MKKYRLLYILLLITVVFLSVFYYLHTLSPNKEFTKFTDSLFQSEVASNTLTLHYTVAHPKNFGIHDYEVTLGSYSSENEQETCAAIENYSNSLSQMNRDALNAKNKLTYDILNYYIQNKQENLDFYYYPEIFSPAQGLHSQLPIVLAEYEFRNEKDITDYLTLLSQMDTFFEEAMNYEKYRMDNGVLMADFSFRTIMDQCDSFLKNKDSHYLKSTFHTRIQECSFLTAEKIEEYEKQNTVIINQHVFPAYQKLRASMAELESMAPSSMNLCNLPQGAKYYEGLVQQETGSSKTIPEIKKMLQQEFSIEFLAYADLVDDYSKMEAAAEDNLFGDSPDIMLSDLKDKIFSDFPEISDADYSIKYVDESLQDFMSPAFYMTPAIDDSLKNVIYINPASNYSSLNLYTTLAHEGYPGHLYQTLYFNQKNNDPIRNLFYFGGYTEGWAVYVEMYSYGLAEENRSICEIQRLNHSIQLCLYSLMDIAIHYDGLQEPDIISNLSRYGITDQESARDIYEYISEEPGNYLKYYVGYLEIMELQKYARQTLGNNFDLKEFNRFLLDVGPAPFDIIKDQETIWLQKQGA